MAMLEAHKTLLKRQRVDLMKNVIVSEELLSHLMTESILTQEMKENNDVGIVFLFVLTVL